MQPVLNVQDVRHVEQALTKEGVSLAELMRRAGAAVAQELMSLEDAHNVVILAGFGNNGGDGWVAAERLAAQGRADAAWVFAAGYEDRLTRIAEGSGDILVRVYTPEDTVFMKLAREKLFAAVYPDLSRQIYRTFIKTALPAEASSNAADPDACYGMSASPNELIRFSLMDGGPGADAAEAISEDYLLLPVRGMLAVLIFSAGMAASIFFLLDRERGCFIWLTDRDTDLTGAFYTGSAGF